MARWGQIGLILAGLLLASFATNAQRQDQTRILFVFDASYSMYGNLQQQSKIAVAKNLLSSLVDTLAEQRNVKLGMRIYGHQTPRRKYDCEDSRLEVGFYPDNEQDIINTIQNTEPKGTTPIAYSLKEAGGDFPASPKARNVIILLTDGIEECQGDPCAVSRSLQKRDVTLKPFVIGIGIEQKYKKKLGCLGRYFNASNKQEFEEALSVVASQAVNRTTAQVKLRDINGQPTETDVNMTFYDANQGIIRHNFYHTMDKSGKPDTLYMDPATEYDLQVHTTPEVWKRGITLKAGEHNNIALDAPQGKIRFKMNGSNYYGRLPAIVKDDKSCNVINEQLEGSEHRYLVDQYNVEILTTPRIRLKNVTVEQDQVNTINIPAPGKLYVSKSQDRVGSIYQQQGSQLKWVCDIAEKVRRERLILQPGKYKLITRPSSAFETRKTSEQEFEIHSGGSTQINVK